jgi:hypothetical protein
MRWQGVLVIFHAKCVILMMSVYHLSLHERMVGNRDARPELLKMKMKKMESDGMEGTREFG